MSTASRKWIVSLILGGILVALALFGGKWQATYAANAGINQIPVIDHIEPAAIAAGSGDMMLIIFGSNFGESEDYDRVWLRDQTHDDYITPTNVIPDGISVLIPASFFTTPTTYTVTVVQSNGQSIPRNPPWDPYDHPSNSVDLVVYTPRHTFLPFADK
jgi:hypothetical protein